MTRMEWFAAVGAASDVVAIFASLGALYRLCQIEKNTRK